MEWVGVLGPPLDQHTLALQQSTVRRHVASRLAGLAVKATQHNYMAAGVQM